MEGFWALVDQTQDEATMRRWDDEIDEKEDRTGVDHEWVVAMPYGARRLAHSPTGSLAEPNGRVLSDRDT
jgi:hypothetical protein